MCILSGISVIQFKFHPLIESNKIIEGRLHYGINVLLQRSKNAGCPRRVPLRSLQPSAQSAASVGLGSKLPDAYAAWYTYMTSPKQL